MIILHQHPGNQNWILAKLITLEFYIGFGTLAIGLIGAFLLILPTTPFLLVAVWAGSHASSKFKWWLLRHKRFGLGNREASEASSCDSYSRELANDRSKPQPSRSYCFYWLAIYRLYQLPAKSSRSRKYSLIDWVLIPTARQEVADYR